MKNSLSSALQPALPTQDVSASEPTPGTKLHMTQLAKALGIKGADGMRKSELASALSKAVTEHGERRVRAPRATAVEAEAPAPIASAPGSLSSAMTPGNATPEETQGAMYPEAAAMTSPAQQAAPQPPATAPPQQNPMMQASALQVPSDIPPDAAMQAEQEAAFHPQVQNRLQRMISLGANPQQIASFLNQSVR